LTKNELFPTLLFVATIADSAEKFSYLLGVQRKTTMIQKAWLADGSRTAMLQMASFVKLLLLFRKMNLLASRLR